jgi:1,4-dihydroxy-2-naphthoate octaprenyltransferase
VTVAASLDRPSWLGALNPPIYLISVLPGLAVAALWQRTGAHVDVLVLATLAVVLLQHAINVLNDAADWRLGADVEKAGSWVRFHSGRPHAAVWHGVLSLLAGGVVGLFSLSLQGQWWLLLIATPLVLLGYRYNAGERPLSYTHFGEWVTGICYGPGVFGCLWLVAGGVFDFYWFAGSLAFAMLAMALLLSHQPPQIETDRAAGKNAFAVRHGAQRTRQVAVGLLAAFVLVTAIAVTVRFSLLHGLAIVAVASGLMWLTRNRVPDPPRVLAIASPLVIVAWLLGLVSG